MSELDIVEKIRRLGERGPRVALGIGDDCAIYRPHPSEELLFTTDQSIEGIHFLPDQSPSIVGYNGRIEFDVSKPDGTPRKLLNVSKLSSLGWSAKTPLEKGLAQTYSWLQDMLGEPKGGRAFWIAGSTSGIVRS